MIKEVYEELPEELQKKNTLKKVSEDTRNGQFMIDSSLEVVNFDKFSKIYAHRMGIPGQPKTNDALYVTEQRKWIFIEFKNGNMKAEDIYRKIYDSLIMVNELGIVDWDFCRKNVSYLLVYNEEKYNENFPKLQESENRSKLHRRIRQYGNTTRKLYGIYKLEGYILERTNTYTREEFKQQFVDKYEKIEAVYKEKKSGSL